MLNNLTTKIKLMLLPITFIGIVFISGIVFNYYDNISQVRTNATLQTSIFIQDVLKGRISVYQYLRVPELKKAQKVRDDFDKLNIHVLNLKPKLSQNINKDLCDKIVSLSKEYIKYFDMFASKRIIEYNNGMTKESKELLSIIKPMVKIGLNLEKQLDTINKSAMKLKEDANESMKIALIFIAIFSIFLFMLISFILSNQIINSLNNFQKGLLEFFLYLNKEKNEVNLLLDNGKDEFSTMAKIVNQNISKTKLLIDQDQALINDVKRIVDLARDGILNKQTNRIKYTK